ncbi:MAG: MATE family efflux transporter [Pseudomonadales bacterium]|nr:MATE family efflux transporter [Pseudomonadales bacterium]
MQQTASLSNLALARQLWQQTWPMALGVMSLLGFQLVDSIFVARLGTASLAAQSFTFPLAFLIIGVQVGVGIAIAALISRSIGAGRQLEANRLGALVLVGGGLLQGGLVTVLWLVQTPVFTLLGASPEIQALIRPYWAVQLPAMWVGGVVYFGYSLFRAHGNTRFPGLMMVVTSLINMVLDPLLIFGIGDWQGFGLPGAALATLLAFAIGGVLLALSLRGKGWIQRDGMLRQMRESALPFFHIAGPAMISQLMPPLAAMLATALVARAGEEAVAAWGMASRLESFSIVLVLGMTMALPPWLGRCYGSNDWHTVQRLMKVGVTMVVGWQVLLGLVLAVLAGPLAAVLVETAPVQAYLTVLIRWLPPSYGLLGVCMLVVSASNALGWPMRAMLISFLRLFLCYLPLLWLGFKLGGFGGLALGAAFGNLMAGVMAWGMYRQALKGN